MWPYLHGVCRDANNSLCRRTGRLRRAQNLLYRKILPWCFSVCVFVLPGFQEGVRTTPFSPPQDAQRAKWRRPHGRRTAVMRKFRSPTTPAHPCHDLEEAGRSPGNPLPGDHCHAPPPDALFLMMIGILENAKVRHTWQLAKKNALFSKMKFSIPPISLILQPEIWHETQTLVILQPFFGGRGREHRFLCPSPPPHITYNV